MSDIKNEVSKKTLSKKDVIKSWLRWFFFAQSNYNYERLQSTAFSHSMLPVLKKLYPDKEELKQEVETHLAFFNTEPICGCVIHGITIAMEEEKANGADEISGDGMNAIKTGLMGPLAGIGDTLTQGVITPIVLAVCIGLTEGGASIAGPILFVIAQYIIMTSISFGMWTNGYKYGKKAVERMNKIGMAIDCSHVGVQTTLDVIEYSKDPIILSHVGARNLWNTKRLTPDEVLIACAKKGGVIGVEAAPHTTITEKNKEHSIESFMEHFEYIKNLVGIDHVAFGPDTVYGDHVKLHSVLAAKFDI